MKILVRCDEKYPFFSFQKATEEEIKEGYITIDISEEEAKRMTDIMVAFDKMQETLEKLDDEMTQRIRQIDE